LVNLLPAGRDLNYYSVSLGYNFLPGEVFIGRSYAFNTDLYLIAGLGSTHFGTDDLITVSYGAGYRFLVNDWLAIHGDVRDYLFTQSILGTAKTSHNLQIDIGATFFF